VGRQLVYRKFVNKETLLLEAAFDLMRRELIPLLEAEVATSSSIAMSRERLVVVARHNAKYADFYRAMLTGSCAYAFITEMSKFFKPFARQSIIEKLGQQLDPNQIEDLSSFVTDGTSSHFKSWVIEGGDPLNPEDLADRLGWILSMLFDRESDAVS